MGPSVAVVTLLMVVGAAVASPAASNNAENAKPQQTTVPEKVAGKSAGSSTAAPVAAASTTGVAAKAEGGHVEAAPHQTYAPAPLHKRPGYLEQLFSETPGAEMPYIRDADRRRSNARFVRAPVKRSSMAAMRSFIPRNKRESSADDDALTLLALWASAANHDDLNLLNGLRQQAYPQSYYSPEVSQPYANYELGSSAVAEDPEIVLPEEDEAYPRYATWSDSDYVVPERFTVMRRSQGGLLPVLPSYHKRGAGGANLEEMPTGGRWGAFAPQRKRFMLAKRTPATQGDVYSLAQMLGEEQSEPNVPLYRRFML